MCRLCGFRITLTAFLAVISVLVCPAPTWPQAIYPYGYYGPNYDRKLDLHRSLSQQDSLVPPQEYQVPGVNPPQVGPDNIMFAPGPGYAYRVPSAAISYPRADLEAAAPVSPTGQVIPVVSLALQDYAENIVGEPLCDCPDECAKGIAWDILSFLRMTCEPNLAEIPLPCTCPCTPSTRFTQCGKCRTCEDCEDSPDEKCASCRECASCKGIERVEAYPRCSDCEDCFQVGTIRVKAIKKKILLQGNVKDQPTKDALAAIARAHAGSNFVLNLLNANPDRTPEAQLIELDIIIAKINWSDVKDIGNNELFNSVNISLPDDANASSLSWSQTLGGDEGTVSTFTGKEVIQFTASARLNALLQTDCAKLLGRPHISVLSGHEAIVQLGGTFATPLITDNVATFEYDTYGTMLVIKPEYKANKDPRMGPGVVAGRITVYQNEKPTTDNKDGDSPSFLDYVGSQASSNVRIPVNHTLVMSGLTQARNTSIDSRTPFLHRIPGANMFFKRHYERVEHTELVVLVTPRIPTLGVTAEEKAFSQQYDGWFVAEHQPLSDAEATQFLLGCEDDLPCQGCRLASCEFCRSSRYLPRVTREAVRQRTEGLDQEETGGRDYQVPMMLGSDAEARQPRFDEWWTTPEYEYAEDSRSVEATPWLKPSQAVSYRQSGGWPD